jgi:zinc/manganese transport system substrate-binding protein
VRDRRLRQRCSRSRGRVRALHRACGPGRRRGLTAVLAAVALGCACTACSSASTGAGAHSARVIRAVASIDAWGSILSQLGGSHVQETSIISSPDIDPHSYEPTTTDDIAIARAQLVVENGIGYDSWAAKAVAANPDAGRDVIDVGQLVGVPAGGNPHQWYSHASVYRVIEAITTDLQELDPTDAGFFARQKTRLETVKFERYNSLEQQIMTRYRGTPVGASESIASPLADSLGLDMKTPYSFLKAISEGTDPAPADIAEIDSQIQGRKIEVYLDNVQNSTPDVAAQVRAAKAAGIPVVAITETLSPRGTSFQDWQAAQLQALETALARSTG